MESEGRAKFLGTIIDVNVIVLIPWLDYAIINYSEITLIFFAAEQVIKGINFSLTGIKSFPWGVQINDNNDSLSVSSLCLLGQTTTAAILL